MPKATFVPSFMLFAKTAHLVFILHASNTVFLTHLTYVTSGTYETKLSTII